MNVDHKILDIFDNKKYSEIAKKSKKNYLKAKPFPHIVIDNFLPKKFANLLSEEYPKQRSDNKKWKYHKHQNVDRYLLEDTTQFSLNLKLFSSAISSRSFILFLETLTGIDALLPDPYYMGGGAMITGSGGFLNVHVDFNWHQKLFAWRKCNILFYLTPGWKESWGGALELWSSNGKKKVTEIFPKFNRVVIFNTTSKSFHGQPDPIRSPKNMPRRVFSAFYYGSIKEKGIDDKPHYTIYNNQRKKKSTKFFSSPYAEQIKKDYLK